jgi:hypothetical protein
LLPGILMDSSMLGSEFKMFSYVGRALGEQTRVNNRIGTRFRLFKS